MSVTPNAGYSPDQAMNSNPLTLGELKEAIEDAILEFGENAILVLDNGQDWGARWGKINKHFGEIEILEYDEENDDDEW